MLKSLFLAASTQAIAVACSVSTCQGDESLHLLQTYVRVMRGGRSSVPARETIVPQFAKCLDGQSQVDDPHAIHVVWSSDLGQVEGLMASISSAIEATRSPLVAHVLVQGRLEADFQMKLGLAPGCRSALLAGRVPLRLHEIDDELVLRARPKMPFWLLKQRGALDSVENYARFYMHRLIHNTKVVIYLDTDTIVQADLAKLRQQFVASNRTIGFAARRRHQTMSNFLVRSNPCKFANASMWERLLNMPAYNAGVYIVDLERWAERGMAARIEGLVVRHNACGGKLWKGGSQPPLSLALYTADDGAAQDFAVLDQGWNVGDLGWRTGLYTVELHEAKILHWNGKRKPWAPNGNYHDLWQPHRLRFDALLHAFV